MKVDHPQLRHRYRRRRRQRHSLHRQRLRRHHRRYQHCRHRCPRPRRRRHLFQSRVLFVMVFCRMESDTVERLRHFERERDDLLYFLLSGSMDEGLCESLCVGMTKFLLGCMSVCLIVCLSKGEFFS